MSDDRAQRNDEQQARWLLAQLLFWHRREDKPDWWTFFHRVGYENDENFVDDRECIGGLELVGEVERIKQSTVYEYAFAPQDHKFREGAKPVDPNTGKPAGEIVGRGRRRQRSAVPQARPEPGRSGRGHVVDPRRRR